MTLTLTLPWLTSRQSSGSFAHILQGSVLGVEVISAKMIWVMIMKRKSHS